MRASPEVFNTTIEHLQSALSGLGLKAIEARLENLLEQAAKAEPSYADFLKDLLGCEVEARRSRYLCARLQLAHLPFVKTFDQFDFGPLPSIDERQIRELRTLRFVHEASNVILLGPPDAGSFCTTCHKLENKEPLSPSFGARGTPRRRFLKSSAASITSRDAIASIGICQGAQATICFAGTILS
jgi:hypothetical protein